MAKATGKAKIRHVETGVIYEVDARDILFETTGYEDRSMGPEYSHQAVVEHPKLGQLLWMIWEYPIGAENYRETLVEPHELVDDIGIVFDGEMQDLIDDRQAKIDEMIDWFHDHYEDPAQNTPFESREGGYQWVWGGPYDASEELSDHFDNESEFNIAKAVENIQASGMTEWARIPTFEDFADEATDIDDLERLILELPEPLPTPKFKIAEDSKIHMVYPHASVASGNTDLLKELRDAVIDLLKSLDGTNAHIDLLVSAQHYNAALTSDPVSATVLYARGIRFENAVTTMKREIEVGSIPALGISAAHHLQSVIDLHASYIATDPEGIELLQAASQYQRPPEAIQDIKKAIDSIQVSVSNLPDLFSDDVREHITNVAEETGRGQYPERSTQVAASTIGQLATSILKNVVYSGGCLLLGHAVVGSGLGSAATSAGSAAIDAMILFLESNATAFHAFVGALGANVAWAGPLGHVFDLIRHKKVGGDEN